MSNKPLKIHLKEYSPIWGIRGLCHKKFPEHRLTKDISKVTCNACLIRIKSLNNQPYKYINNGE